MRSIFFLFVAGLLNISLAHAASPQGDWETIDDVTGKPKSIVRITELPNHTLEGRVIKLYTDPGRVCSACSDARKNQPIVGMKVINGLKLKKPAESLWSDGQILDPKNGKIYNCNMQVFNNDTSLRVRGFIGVPLFGRTQTWRRISVQS